MSQRAASFVSRLFGRRPVSSTTGPSAAETLKRMASERRDEDAVAYRRQLFVDEPDLLLPVLVEVRMGETFLRHADPVHARMSFDRALTCVPAHAAQAVWLRLARLAQQLAHPVENELLERLLSDRTLDPDLRPKLERRLRYLNGDTSWSMPAIGDVAPAPWEEPPDTAPPMSRPQDLGAWHDAARDAANDEAIQRALCTSLEMEAPEPPGGGIRSDAPSWGASAERPQWNPATPRLRSTGSKRRPRRRPRNVPLAAIPTLNDD